MTTIDSTVDSVLIASIKEAALNLPVDCRDLQYLDTLLGVVEGLVHEARQCIDDEWAFQRRNTALRPRPTPTLDDLA